MNACKRVKRREKKRNEKIETQRQRGVCFACSFACFWLLLLLFLLLLLLLLSVLLLLVLLLLL